MRAVLRVVYDPARAFHDDNFPAGVTPGVVRLAHHVGLGDETVARLAAHAERACDHVEHTAWLNLFEELGGVDALARTRAKMLRDFAENVPECGGDMMQVCCGLSARNAHVVLACVVALRTHGFSPPLDVVSAWACGQHDEYVAFGGKLRLTARQLEQLESAIVPVPMHGIALQPMPWGGRPLIAGPWRAPPVARQFAWHASACVEDDELYVELETSEAGFVKLGDRSCAVSVADARGVQLALVSHDEQLVTAARVRARVMEFEDAHDALRESEHIELDVEIQERW